MRHYESSALIAASPESVWAVLADGSQYPDWDSGISRIDGDIADGARITLHTVAEPQRPRTVLVAIDPPRLMVWTGGLPLGLFRGTRTFALDDAPGGRTLFTVREEFTGPLLGLVWRSMPDLQPQFDRFAMGLRARVEDRYGRH